MFPSSVVSVERAQREHAAYVITQYGPQWLNVTNPLSARAVRLGAQVGF